VTGRERRPRRDDSEEWEVVEDVPTRPLGSVVSVRFEADAARKVRACANSLGLTLSEFVRQAALAATESPQLLGKMRPPTGYPYIVVTGSASLSWSAQYREPAAANTATVPPGDSESNRIFPVAQPLH
jgi:hypothetical protein